MKEILLTSEFHLYSQYSSGSDLALLLIDVYNTAKVPVTEESTGQNFKQKFIYTVFQCTHSIVKKIETSEEAS